MSKKPSKSVQQRRAAQSTPKPAPAPAAVDAAQNSLATEGASVGSSEADSENPTGDTNMTTETTNGNSNTGEIVFNRDTKQRKGKALVYRSPNFAGTLRIPASSAKTAPSSLTVTASDGEFRVPGSKLSKEERAAKRAQMTPAQKAEQAQKLADQLARRAARLKAEAEKAASVSA